MNISISINSNYVMPAVVMITSLFENNADEKIDVYILYSNLDVKEKTKLLKCAKNCKQNIILKKIDVNIFKDAPLGAHFTVETYYRLLIPNILPQNIGKVLYLDVDIIINKPLKKLYYKELKNCYYIVCEDIVCYNIKSIKKIKKRLNIPLKEKYFNAGVMLYNLDLIRKEVNINDILEYIKYNRKKILTVDQDVLNALFYDRTKYEDYRYYNFQVLNIKEERNLYFSCKNMVIIHYNGYYKPWKCSYTGVFDSIFWTYAKKAGYNKEYFKYKVCNSVYRNIRKYLEFVIDLLNLDLL